MTLPSAEEVERIVGGFEEYLNEPPQYEDKRLVRDYRHEAYRKWKSVQALYLQFAAFLRAMEKESTPSVRPKRPDYQADWTYVDSLEDYADAIERALATVRREERERIATYFEATHRELWTPSIAEEIRALADHEPEKKA